MKDAREWMLRVGMIEKMHFQKNGEDGKSVIVDPKSVYTSDLMNGWAKNELKELTEQLSKANHLLIELEPNLEDEKQDEVTAYLDKYKI
ncbi:unnamed protein product [marine sediment metagenome]|uniref:Uncharacterized protein n=1 Tax=marine sediment metagenome TaxID=412755 RepID=X1B4H9_9ZZZZ